MTQAMRGEDELTARRQCRGWFWGTIQYQFIITPRNVSREQKRSPLISGWTHSSDTQLKRRSSERAAVKDATTRRWSDTSPYVQLYWLVGIRIIRNVYRVRTTYGSGWA